MSAAVLAARGGGDKENCCQPFDSSLPLPVKSARPPLSRRVSSSILRLSAGQSQAAPSHSTRLSLSGRRKSVSFAAAMEEVRLFDSRDALSQLAALPAEPAAARQQRQLEQQPTSPPQQQELEESSARGADVAVAASEDSSESMEFTQLLGASAATPMALPSVAACVPCSPSADMELTALLHTLPRLVTAAGRAARRCSAPASGATAPHTPTQQRVEDCTLPTDHGYNDSGDLLDWLTPHSRHVETAAPACPSTPTAGIADASVGTSEETAYAQRETVAAEAESSMELTELLTAYGDGSEHSGDQSGQSHAADATDDDGVDMEMTAILSKWSERSRLAALSPFAARSQRPPASGTSHLSGPSPPHAVLTASARLSQRPTRSPSQVSAGECRVRRLSARLSASGVAAADSRQQRRLQWLSTPASPTASTHTRASLAGSRASAGVVGMGEQTAALSARWLEMMDVDVDVDADAEEQQRPAAHRLSSASSVTMGDCTADIAAMLEAVLMDGQPAEDAMQLFQQHSDERRKQQSRHQPGHDDDEDDSVGWKKRTHDSNEPGPVSAHSSTTARLQLLSAPVSPTQPASSAVPAPSSPAAPFSQPNSSTGQATPLEPSAAADVSGSLPASFLDSAFHLLGVASMDDSNLHARLRKRDSSFQPANGPTDDESGAAGSSAEESLLTVVVARRLLAGEELDELQSACLQLMDVNAQLRDEAAQRHAALAQRHTAPVAAGQSSLQRFLTDIARSASAANRPTPPPALCRAVSSHYSQCVQQARLGWLAWQSELSRASGEQADGSCRQMEADVEMAAEVAALQTRAQQVRRAALQDVGVQRSRQVALLTRQRYTAAQQRATLLASLTATQQRQEEAMAVSLRQEALALQEAAERVEQQQLARQQCRLSRAALSAMQGVSQCRVTTATSSHVDIILQPLSCITLRCARLDATQLRHPDALSDDICTYYQLARLHNKPDFSSPQLQSPLVLALQTAVDNILSVNGARVALGGLPALVRRCATLSNRALLWEHSIEAVVKQHGARLVVSVTSPRIASAEFALSVRCQSPSRQHQLVCQFTVSLAVDAHLVTSVVRHSTRLFSLSQSMGAASIEQRFSNWMRCDRVDGYGQMERAARTVSEMLSAL